MSAHRYRFRSAWTQPGARADVAAVLQDVAAYPQWWPQVRSVVRVDDETGDVVCRSFLPYSLRFRMAAQVQEPDLGRFEATLSGDLDGWCRWTLVEQVDGTHLEFDQEVTTRGRRLRAAATSVAPCWSPTTPG